MHPTPPHSKSRIHFIFLAALVLLPATLAAQQATITPLAPLPATLKIQQPELIVVGFAGGFIKSTSSIHGEIALALHLRDQYAPTIHSEIFYQTEGLLHGRPTIHAADPAATKILGNIPTF
jgi:hypothetical protein